MNKRATPISIRRLICLVTLVFTLFLNSCTLTIPSLNTGTATPIQPAGPTFTPQPAASINFKVTLPAPLPAGEVLELSVVDEVTGLGLNPANYPMQGMDSLHFSANVPFGLNSVVKYRYMRQGHLPTLETTSAGTPVRYRMVYVNGPAEVDDIVSAWGDAAFNSPSGRIAGQIVDASNHAFIPDILVAAGGQQTLTDSNGRFSLENLPAGTHNLVTYALNGAFQTLQQGAVVAIGKTTQANLTMTPAALIHVQFTVSMPPKTIPGVPVRLAGNLYQVGNTYGDLQGGLSTVASRMPQLAPQPDGRYSVTLSLPAGADFRYKYTLGDGFWNAEHNLDGSFVTRQFIVPAGPQNLQVQDAIQTWSAGSSSPILFEATIPSTTPVTDIPSIQFNPYGWTEPIPMWAKGNNQWVYELYSPLNMLGEFSYRYCRNDQCGVADDADTSSSPSGRMVSTSLTTQDLQDTIKNWTWSQAAAAPQLSSPVTRRPDGFWAGVEFLPVTDPTWQSWMPLAIQNVQGLRANWLVLSPSWTISRTDPLVFSPVPGSDPLWADTQDSLDRAQAVNLNTALFPTVHLPGDAATWWKSAPRNPGWWDTWFNRYMAYAEYFADLATKTESQALILGGGDWLTPAFPNGTLSDGSASGVPPDAETRWEDIITQVRLRFTGQIMWAVPYSGSAPSVPQFVHQMDGVYLLWYAPLNGSTVDDLAASAGTRFDDDIHPFQTSLGEQLVIAPAYPSIDGSAAAAQPLSTALRPANGQGTMNLQAQADVYEALLQAVNERDWVDGFISRGFYPPVGLQDTSASVHAKPAAAVLQYWYTRVLGLNP